MALHLTFTEGEVGGAELQPGLQVNTLAHQSKDMVGVFLLLFLFVCFVVFCFCLVWGRLLSPVAVKDHE